MKEQVRLQQEASLMCSQSDSSSTLHHSSSQKDVQAEVKNASTSGRATTPNRAKRVSTPVRSHAIPSNTNYLQSSERTTTIVPSSPGMARTAKFGGGGSSTMQTSTQTTSQIELISVSSDKMPVPVNDSWYTDKSAKSNQSVGTKSESDHQRPITPVPVESEWYKKDDEAELEEQQCKAKEEEEKKMEEAYRREKEKALRQAQKKVEEEVRKKQLQEEEMRKQQLEELQKQEELLRQEQASLEARVEDVLQQEQKIEKSKQALAKNKKQLTKLETEELDKKRLEEYRKAQDILSGTEDTSQDEHSKDHDTVVNEHKLLEDAIKGKVKGNIAMFSRQSVEREGSVEGSRSASRGGTRVKVTSLRQRTSSEDREDNEKMQRAKELEIIASTRAQASWDNPSSDQEQEAAHRAAMKNRELMEVANIRSAADRLDDVTDAEERAKFEKECRSRELQEIAAFRKPNWEDVVSSANNGQNRTGVMDLEEARANIRGAASAWQEREKQKTTAGEKGKQAPPAVPTRRIGNLFSHNSSQWRMEPDEEDEPFPAPPSQEEVNNNQLFEEYLNDCYSSEDQGRSGTPAPPPRDSSKDYMMEYQHTTTSAEQSWSNN